MWFFSSVNSGDLGVDITARGPQVTKPAGAIVFWSDLVHDMTGKVPFRIRPDILESDEAIVAVFAHEMYELEKLRPILQEGETSIEQFVEHTRAGNPGNYHDEAWEVADCARRTDERRPEMNTVSLIVMYRNGAITARPSHGSVAMPD